MVNFIVPDTDDTNLPPGIPVLEDLINIEQVRPINSPEKANITKQKSDIGKNESKSTLGTESSSSGSSLHVGSPINFAPQNSDSRTVRPQQEDLVFEAAPPNRRNPVAREIIPTNPGADPTANDNAEVPTSIKQNSEIEIEKDTETNEIVVKRIWAKKLVTADRKFFKSDTRSILNLKSAFDWVNCFVLKIKDKKTTFRTLLENDIFFDLPCLFRDERLSLYNEHIRQTGKPSQDLVVIFQAFFRNLLKTICKPDTFMLLSRNLDRLGTDSRTRGQIGALIDALLAEAEPTLNGRSNPISGRKIEQIFRANLNRILENVEGVTPIEVNFRKSNLSFEFQLRTLLKFSQFSWSTVAGMNMGNLDLFDQNVKDEMKEAQLLLRSLLNRDIVPPG